MIHPAIAKILEKNKRAQAHPEFREGDTIKVHVKIKEGDKERTQIFEGVVIAFNNSGMSKTITVRKISFGHGVERIFPLNAPVIETSGVRRSCATLSVTSRMPFISRSMRSSMRFKLSDKASNSSPDPVSGTRRVRSPAMISPAARLMVSSRRSMLRPISAPPAVPRSRISTTVQGKVVVNIRSVR